MPLKVLVTGFGPFPGALRMETQAINARSVLLPDAAGTLPSERAIDPQGPACRTGRAPHQRASGVPTRLSRDAGRYLCNFAFWHALEAAAAAGGPAIVQFVHVPLVRTVPIPVSRRRRRWLTPADLDNAAEAILLVLVSAAKSAASEAGVWSRRIAASTERFTSRVRIA
jgi:pyroglutamyl-peptidase